MTFFPGPLITQTDPEVMKKGDFDPAFSKFMFYQTMTPNEVGGDTEKWRV